MKPNFTLHLGYDAIRLLHRVTDQSQILVGEASLGGSDEGDQITSLQRKAVRLSAGEMKTDLVVPISEVFYASCSAPGTSDEQRSRRVREFLGGRTSYDVSELVFDWRADDGSETAQVAAVAKETLRQAEEFAIRGNFNPVCFSGHALPGQFDRPPEFGRVRDGISQSPPGNDGANGNRHKVSFLKRIMSIFSKSRNAIPRTDERVHPIHSRCREVSFENAGVDISTDVRLFATANRPLDYAKRCRLALPIFLISALVSGVAILAATEAHTQSNDSASSSATAQGDNPLLDYIKSRHDLLLDSPQSSTDQDSSTVSAAPGTTDQNVLPEPGSVLNFPRPQVRPKTAAIVNPDPELPLTTDTENPIESLISGLPENREQSDSTNLAIVDGASVAESGIDEVDKEINNNQIDPVEAVDGVLPESPRVATKPVGKVGFREPVVANGAIELVPSELSDSIYFPFSAQTGRRGVTTKEIQTGRRNVNLSDDLSSVLAHAGVAIENSAGESKSSSDSTPEQSNVSSGLRPPDDAENETIQNIVDELIEEASQTDGANPELVISEFPNPIRRSDPREVGTADDSARSGAEEAANPFLEGLTPLILPKPVFRTTTEHFEFPENENQFTIPRQAAFVPEADAAENETIANAELDGLTASPLPKPTHRAPSERAEDRTDQNRFEIPRQAAYVPEADAAESTATASAVLDGLTASPLPKPTHRAPSERAEDRTDQNRFEIPRQAAYVPEADAAESTTTASAVLDGLTASPLPKPTHRGTSEPAEDRTDQNRFEIPRQAAFVPEADADESTTTASAVLDGLTASPLPKPTHRGTSEAAVDRTDQNRFEIPRQAAYVPEADAEESTTTASAELDGLTASPAAKANAPRSFRTRRRQDRSKPVRNSATSRICSGGRRGGEHNNR